MYDSGSNNEEEKLQFTNVSWEEGNILKEENN